MKRFFLCLTTILFASQMWAYKVYYGYGYGSSSSQGKYVCKYDNNSTYSIPGPTSSDWKTTSAGTYNYISPSNSNYVHCAAMVTDNKYRFKGWYKVTGNVNSSNCVSTDNPYTFQVGGKDWNMYAVFELDPNASSEPEPTSLNAPGAVDLGLSVLWADRNLGAASSTASGYFYAWGEIEPKSNYVSSGYTFPNSWADANDVAKQKLGNGWRMPTYTEVSELVNNTECSYTSSGVTMEAANGAQIYFPRAGYMDGTSLATNTNNRVWLWTSSSYSSGNARIIFAQSNACLSSSNYYQAFYGMPVRAVYAGTTATATFKNYDNSTIKTQKVIPGTQPTPPANPTYSDNSYTYTFTGWSPAVSSINTSTTFTAQYSKVAKAGVTVSASPSAGGNPTASSVSNGNCTLTANPANGYQFVNWTEGNSVLSTAETYNMTGVNSARTVVANYVLARTVHQNNALNTDIFAMNEGGTELAGPTSNYVDLGLSVYWATKNIGANSIGEAGTHVAWGEVASKASYTANTYSISGLSALNSASNDLAMAQWGNGWRTPTTMEFQELIEGCDWTWEVQDHQWGYTVSSKTNSNSIFLPASGYLYNNVEMLAGTWGYYWANSVSNIKGNANCLKIAHPSGEDLYQVSNDVAHNGDVVRAVYPKPAKTYTLTIGTNQGTNVNTYTGTYGQTIRIKVVCESENHHFAGWSDGNTDALRTFTISGDARYDAIFEQNVSGTEVTNDAGMEAVESGSAVTVSGDVSVTATVQDLDMVRVTNKSGLTIGDGHALVINDLTIDKGSSITIESGGSVIVNGTLNDQNEDGSGIIVKADENDMGTLAIEHDGEFELIQPYGSVELYTMAGLIGGSYKWQHFGIPTVEKPVITKSASYTTWYYKWDLQEGWINGGSKSLEPWKGFNLTNKSPEGGVTYTFTGQLVGNAPMAFSCDQKGWYVIANSYTKPIYLKTLMEALSAQMDVDAQVQLYEPVYHENSLNLATITMDDIDENSQNYQKYNRVLPMQAFFIRYMSNINGDFQLPYVDATQVPEELNQVAARRAPAASVNKVVITMTDNLGGGDQLTLREKPSYTIGYDSGSDATKILAMVPNIYVTTTEGAQGSFAVPALIGSYIDIKTSEATQYTLTFSEQMGTEYAIKDTQTGAITNMNAESSYVFQAEPNKVIPNRFVVVERRNTPTALDEEEAVYEAGVRKVVEDGTVYILKNGIRYNLLGAKANK